MMAQVSNGTDTIFGGSISENNINDVSILIMITISNDHHSQSFPPSVIVINYNNNNNNNSNNGLILDHGENINVVVSAPLDLESCLSHKFGIFAVRYNGYITSNSWDPSLSKGGKLMTECKCLILKCGVQLISQVNMKVLMMNHLLVHQVVIFIQIMVHVVMVLCQIKAKIARVVLVVVNVVVIVN